MTDPRQGIILCWSGLQIQGTAISPAAWKLYDKFMLIQYTCETSICQGSLVLHFFLCYNKFQNDKKIKEKFI